MSGDAETRLRALGIELPAPPAPAAAYVPAVRSGTLVFVAGQVAAAGGALVATGKVGAEVDRDTGRRCARQCAINVLAQLKGALGDLNAVRRVLKLTVFVASAPGFTDQHLVADGASELLREVLGDVGGHARSAVGVAALPLDSPVEVDAVAEAA
ncbi:MAG TPA: RidA family protein [Egibacteraceae bacterium]|nr:RidA family protein [Egibacteraceae bacterium]